jgi:hypothetical protein
MVRLLLVLVAMTALRAGEGMTLLLPPDVQRDYQAWLAGRDVHAFVGYGGSYARRDVAEVALALRALRVAGLEEEIGLAPAPSVERILADLRLGAAVMSATSLWRSDIDGPTLAAGPALIGEGEFEAGFYVRPGTPAGLLGLRAVVDPTWRPDLATWQAIGPATILHAPGWASMVRMVEAGRADVLLAPFQPTADLSLSAEGITLLPISGLKAGLAGTRHWAVSLTHPRGAEILALLVRGVALLRERGDLPGAYRACGFMDPRVAEWTRIGG